MTIDTSKLKRYKPGYVHSNDGPGYISMLARDDGEYVRLEDVKAISSAIEQALTQQRGGSSVRIEDLGIIAPMRHPERADAEQAYSITAHDFEKNPIGSRDWTIYWRGWWHRSQLYTTPQPSADAVRELVLLSRGLAKRTFNRSTAEMYIHFADELESLISGGSHA